MIGPLEEALLEARALCALPGNDFTWSSWHDAPHALGELDGLLEELRRTARVPPGVGFVLTPTGPMQELALSSGWGDRFLDVADRIELAAARLDLVGLLRERLAAGRELPAATAVPSPDLGVTAVDAGPDRAVLRLDPPVDAEALCRAWYVTRPVAVSGDVEQRGWTVMAAGARLEDPHGHRIAADGVRAGGWIVDAHLTGRPPGPLPGVVAGASPAYPVVPGLLVGQIDVRPGWH